MLTVDLPAESATLADMICKKLQESANPLKLAEVAKGLKKPKKTKKPDFEEEVRAHLDELTRQGIAFHYPSAKGGTERYWHKDEKHLLRTRAVELAAEPQTLSGITRLLAREIRGVDSAFVDIIVRELIGDDQLFEYPAATARGGPRFGAVAPPPPLPPLQRPNLKRKVDKLILDANKLLNDSHASLDELIHLLIERLRKPNDAHQAVTPSAAPVPEPSAAHELDELIMKEVNNNSVVMLPELRAAMPVEFRTTAFDEAVIRLAENNRILVYQDSDSSSFSEAQLTGFVRDGSHVYTSISKR
jgi:hypothetical protein